MIIYTYIFCWNEEKILPFTLDHYSQFSDRIFLLDNYSTDKSLKIASKYAKVTVIPISCEEEGDTYDEFKSAKLRSTIYKDETYGFQATGKADWAILVDADEFVYHPDLVNVLKGYKEQGVAIPRLAGYDMFSKEFPIHTKGELLTSRVKRGNPSPSESKPVMLDPSKVEVKFSVGAHFHSEVRGSALPSINADIKLLHYKNLSKDYVVRRYKQLAPRSSCTNKANKFGEHWYSKKIHKSMEESFDTSYKNAKKVI
jgi:glycosyltransferase involved in cell wall biosynthesis